MNMCNNKAIELAATDVVFARILTSPEPLKAMRRLQLNMWLQMTDKFVSEVWVYAAIDAKEGIFKPPMSYTTDIHEQEEINHIHKHFKRFNQYADMLSRCKEKPFSDYLNGISVADFRTLLQHLRGMDAAREIQALYMESAIDHDLGGSQLHRYMVELELPYVPTVNHLNAARRGEISKGRYDMSRSRSKNKQFMK